MTKLITLTLTLAVPAIAVAAPNEVATTVPPVETKAPTFVESLIGGKASAAFRYRYEYLDREDLPLHARPSTLRAALGYETRPFHGFSVLGQFEGVTNLGPRDWRLPTADATHRQNRGDNINRPVVVEPIGAEVNQALIRYANPFLTAKLGRQEIALNNSRIISVIPWRQSNQTFDAASLEVTPLAGLGLSYIFINQVNRTVGQSALDGQLKMSTHVGNVSYKRAGQVNVAVYDVRLDYRDLPELVDGAGQPALDPTGQPRRVADGSTNTVGGRIEGPWKLGDAWGLLYGLEYARQTSIAGNPLKVAANYYSGELGIAYRGFGLRGVYSVRGGTSDAAGDAFQTPLSHSWDGWAENFARTPRTGLRSLSANLTGPVPGVEGLTLTAVYFEFFADSAAPDGTIDRSDHYGREVNGGLEYRLVGLDRNWALGSRIAYYAEDKLAPGKIPNGAANLRLGLYTTYAF